MRRFWIEEIIADDQSSISFFGETLHHIRDVCRMNKGARFEVLTSDRKAYFVELVKIDKKEARANVIEQRVLPRIPGPKITLCLSLPKFSTFENVIEKSVELGVHNIQPFFSDFSFVKNSSKISVSRVSRWAKIVKSATQQSGRGELMPIEEPLPLTRILKNFNQNNELKGLFCYEGVASKTLGEVMEEWDCPSKIWVFVGSEGGFSESEVELFQQYSLVPATLGEQILRVETACVALVSIIKYQMKALG